jgi:hypothetical protein
MQIRLAVPILAAVLGAVTLSGCVVAPPRQQIVYTTSAPPTGPVVYTEMAPPPPQTEVIGVAPAGYFWLSGFWLWEGGRHVWHPGHWEAHRQGYSWTPHRWVQTGHGWQLHGGFWARG